eukprot:m.420333 g.420333  ORF g.420333 m.420333 type:complete len:347 (+) comp21316_c0_seq7:224-1264(+)
MSDKRPKYNSVVSSNSDATKLEQLVDTALPHKMKSANADTSSGNAVEELPPVPYCAEQRILIVGDGNLSWARALCMRLGSGANIIATTYEPESELLEKYPESADIVRTLKESYGATVAHEIDATQLLHPKYVSLFRDCHERQLGKSRDEKETSVIFDRIIFMFPLVPLTKTLEAHKAAPDPVISNKLLIWKFLRCASEILEPVKGEIHIASKDVKPYTMWRIPDLADGAERVAYLRCEKFDAAVYPGYETRKPTNNHFDRVESFPLTNCWTYIFHQKHEMSDACDKDDRADGSSEPCTQAQNYCKLCKKQMTSKDMYDSHLNGKKHGLQARIHARFTAALEKENLM